MTDKEKIELIKSECQRLIDQTEDGGMDWNGGCAWGRRLVAGHILSVANIQSEEPILVLSEYKG